MVRWKYWVGTALTSRPAQTLVRLAYGRRIPARDGSWFDTDSDLIQESDRVSIFLGLYEPTETRCIKQYLRRDLDVLEVGSSLGVIASLICRKLEPGRRLVCVEASPALIPLLRRNVAGNARRIQTAVVHAAISHAEAGWHTIPWETGGSSLTSRIGADGDSTVPAVDLVTVLADHQLGRYTLICDIEGAEAELLRSGVEGLRTCDQVIAELHDVPGTTVDMMIGQFQALGFAMTHRRGNVVVMDRK